MMYHGSVGVRNLSCEREGDEIRAGAGGKFADFARHPQRAGAVDGCHPENFFSRNGLIMGREKLHLVQQA